MSVWTDLAGKLEEGGKIVADKAKDLSKLANLKAQIVGCDNTIIKNYKELGKAYYEAHKDDEAMEYAEYMLTITEAMAKKAELNNQIAELKAAADEEKAADIETEDVATEAIEDIASLDEEVEDTIE